MKLEIKHLSPYLPYGLKIDSRGFEKLRTMDADIFNDSDMINIGASVRMQYKPILRPLSDFNYRDNWGYAYKEMFYEDVKNKTISVKLLEELLKDHIDVFGLIEKGLAIDINNLKH